MPDQMEYINSSVRFTAFVAGFGAGKSYADVGKCLNIMQKRRALNQKATIAFLAPNYGLLRDVNILKTEEFLNENKINYTINKSSNILKIPVFGGEIWFRSMHHPETIVGFDASDAILDEFDIIDRSKQEIIWNKTIARLRKYDDASLSISTTPEGYKKTYDLFVQEKVGKLIQVDTRKNIFLPKDYIESLEGQYDGQLLEQYLKGQFVNIAGLSAYYEFDRKRHIKEYPNVLNGVNTLHIGIDFNVDPMCAVIGIMGSKPNGNKKIIVFDEVEMMNANTYKMTDLLNHKYRDYQLYYYPDMTGKARKTSAVQTDIDIIKRSGGIIRGERNMFVRDSLNIINKAFQDDNLEIIPKCKVLIKDLEQVTRDQYGGIDKKDKSITHMSDAFRYLVDRNFARVATTRKGR